MGYEDELQRARAKREAAKRGENQKRNRSISVEHVERSAKISTNNPNNRKRKKGKRPLSPRQKAKRRRVRNIILLAFVATILLIAGLVYAFVQSKFDKFQKPDFKEEDVANTDLAKETVEKMKGYTTIALFGVDARDNDSLGKGVHADVDMIANINNETGEIKLVSVYRDSYFSISDKSYNKLTQAYFEGGPKQAIEALNKNLDLNITKYATFNWAAVATAINVFGGVDVEITKEEFRVINGFITETVKGTGIGTVQLKSAGMNHLDGVQAVAYARLRKMDTDYQRTERQRLIMSLTMEKAKQADLTTLLGTVDLIFPMISTNIDMGTCISLAKNFNNYYLGETTGFPFQKDSKIMGKKGDCVIPLNLEEDVQQLHEFLFGGSEEGKSYTPSETVKKISKKILSDAGSIGGSSKTNSAKTETTEAPTSETKVVVLEGESQSSEVSTSEGAFVEVPTDESGNPLPSESAMEPSSETEYGPGVSGPGVKPTQTTEAVGPGVTKPLEEINNPTNPTNPINPTETLPQSTENMSPGSMPTQPAIEGPGSQPTSPAAPGPITESSTTSGPPEAQVNHETVPPRIE